MSRKPNTENTGIPLKMSLLSYRVQAAILAIVGFIFYCNTFTHEAAFDDRMAVTGNEYVQQGFAGIGDILTKDAYESYLEQKNGSNQLSGGRYRPLSLITFGVEQQFMGTDHDRETANEKETRIAKEMGARHVINVLLYIVTVLVLLHFLRIVVFPEDPVIAFLAALIFMIHPVHTEVVANVKSRDEILSLLFISLTFIKAFSYKETKKRKDLLWACSFFFLALLSKEYAVTLLVLLPISFYLFKNEPASYSIKTSLLYLIPFALYLALRLSAVSGSAAGAENDIMNNPYLYATPAQKLSTEILVLLHYLNLLLFPNVLTSDYSYAQVPYTDFSNPLVWLSVGIYLSLIVSMVLFLRKRQVLGFAIAFFLLPMLLVSNIFFNIGAPMGERLIFHSSVGFAIAAGYLLFTGFGKLNIATISRNGLTGFVIVLVIASGFKTIERNKDWKNDETLSFADVKTSPNSVRVNNNAAAACMALAKRNINDISMRNEWLQKAIGYFDKAIAINPKYMLPRINRGLCYYNIGQPEKAMPDWDTVRKYEPAAENLQKYLSIESQYFLSRAINYQNKNLHDSAVYAARMSLDANPQNQNARQLLDQLARTR